METTLTINIPAPSARARGAGVGEGGSGGDKEEKIKTHSEKITSYKDKFHKTREKYDKVTAAHEMHQKNLDVANDIVRRLQAENDLLLDAMFLADAGLYDRHFSTGPGSVSSPLDPYMFPESAYIPSILAPPPLPSSQLHYSPQHRYQPPPHSNPYPHQSHSSSAQAIAGPSPSSHHPQRPHHHDHHQHVAKKRRSDVGPSPPEDLGFVGVPPSVSASASASNNANLSSSSSIPAAVDFDPQYDIPYKRTSRSSTGHHGHPSHLNGNSNGGGGPSGHTANGTGNVRSLEHLVDEDIDMKDVLPEVVNGRS